MLTAGTAASRVASRSHAEELIDRVDWSELARHLDASRVLGLLGERITALAGERAPESFTAATQRALHEGCSQDAVQELISIQLMDAFRAAGIRSVPLKGPLLGEAVYGQPGRRPSADIDLLLASEDLPPAIEIARRFGYLGPDPDQSTNELPLLHFGLLHESGELPPLELHWRVHWYEPSFSREMLFRSVDNGQLGWRALPVDELVSLLLFYARDGFVGLRLACDLAAWWDRFGDMVQPGALAGMIARHPELERVILAAAVVAERVVGLPRAALLDGIGEIEPRVHLAARLANPCGHGSPQQRTADVWLVDWLLTPHGGRRDCFRRQLHAPAATAKAHAETGREGRLSSLDRGARLARRYALSLLRGGWGVM